MPDYWKYMHKHGIHHFTWIGPRLEIRHDPAATVPEEVQREIETEFAPLKVVFIAESAAVYDMLNS